MILPVQKSKHTIRASSALTSSYVAGTVVSLDTQNFIGLMISYTKGDETSMQVKIESSIDGGDTYFQQAVQSTSGSTTTVSAGVYEMTATANVTFTINPIKADLIKVSVKATGGTPTGTCAITAVTSWV